MAGVEFLTAEFRRFVDSGVLRFFVWSAYMAADATAIFVLGHMSVTSRSSEHHLVAFWAPFLLIHLGGQDNITAYAIEDSRLWLRHLQTLAVQAAAAGYVIYESSIIGSPALLRWAAIVMFVVGVLKYGERVWALRCAAGGSPKGKNYKMLRIGKWREKYDNYLWELLSKGPADTETYLLVAQHTLDVPMDLLKGTNIREVNFQIDLREEGRLYKVAELQLSLMYDVFYTKAEVMHNNLSGLCIRMLSTVATAVTLLLFRLLIVLSDYHRSYSKVDVAVTYVLLVGAVVLETASLLRAMFSTWTCALLMRRTGDNSERRYSTVRRFAVRSLTCLRRLICVADWRRRCSWSRTMGQHNLLELCTRSITSRRSKIARFVDTEDWWNRLAYSWSIPVSPLIEKLLMDEVLYRDFDSWGEAELKRWGLYEQRGLYWRLEDKIIAWHIASCIYLSWWSEKHTAKTSMVEAVEALSNYMMFLLASRPHMLPPTTNRDAYMEICHVLVETIGRNNAKDLIVSPWEDLINSLGGFLNGSGPRETHIQLLSLAQASRALGEMLLAEESRGEDKMLELLTQVWLEALFYAGKSCTADSHVKQLSNGGELITVAALLLQHMTRCDVIDRNRQSRHASSMSSVDGE